MITPVVRSTPALALHKWLLGVLVIAGFVGFGFTQDYALGAQTHETVENIGGLMIVACILGRTWCALYTSGGGAPHVLDQGPYSVVRNPAHLFTFIGAAGVGAQSGSMTVAAIFFAMAILAVVMLVGSEERVLLKAWGATYADYMKSTPRFLANFGLWRDNAELIIKPAPVMRAFVQGLILLLAIPLAEGLQYLRGIHNLPIVGNLP